jgi:hypothetical protein
MYLWIFQSAIGANLVTAYPAILHRLESGWKSGQMNLFSWDELAADRIATSGAGSTLEVAERIGQRVAVACVRQTSHCSRHDMSQLRYTNWPMSAFA